MQQLTADKLIAGIESTLRQQGVDVDYEIAALGQVEAARRRAAGQNFSLTEHVRGLVLAQLSCQRPWRPIARSLEAVSVAFLGFDPVALETAPSGAIVAAVKGIRCGNRAIKSQVEALPHNIAVLRAIEIEHGSIDRFVTSAPPLDVARALAMPGRYKLRALGITLACEYLKNVGIRIAKPDVHILRILGDKRLGLLPERCSEPDAIDLINKIAADGGCTSTYLDNLVWLFGAKDYGEICSANPKCEVCRLRSRCKLGSETVVH